MIAQIGLSILLAGVMVYAWTEYRRAPVIAILALLAAIAGLYFVWLPTHATRLAALVGIGLVTQAELHESGELVV